MVALGPLMVKVHRNGPYWSRNYVSGKDILDLALVFLGLEIVLKSWFSAQQWSEGKVLMIMGAAKVVLVQQ